MESVYRAAGAWVDRGLRSDDSLFTPGKEIWSHHLLGELHNRFLDRPDEGSRPFLDKLRDQLQGSPADVYQLMAEVLYVHYLLLDNNEQAVRTVLAWSPNPVSFPSDLASALQFLRINTGAARTNIPFQVGTLIESVEQWKELEPSERDRLLEDQWAFKEFLFSRRFESKLLVNNQKTGGLERHVLLHIVFPDTFEPILQNDKQRITRSPEFARFIDSASSEIDRQIQEIRQGLETEWGRDFSFYDNGVTVLWRNGATPSPWYGFVNRAKEYMAKGNLAGEEIDYKLRMASNLGMARNAVLANADDWQTLVKRGFAGNLIFSIEQAKLRDWIDESPDDALLALQALWTHDDSSLGERIRDFCSLLPRSASSGLGTRTTVVSVLLMGLDPERYPPFRVGVFDQAYDELGYARPAQEADEAEIYDHALGFLDRFMHEASRRELELRHRLDAQSVVWQLGRSRDESPVTDSEEPDAEEHDTDLDFLDVEMEAPPLPLPEPEAPYSLDHIIADGCFLTRDRLQDMLSRLQSRKNLILQGPPGTGKTWLARRLAYALLGSRSERRVRPLQFHPNLSYEDFVRGWRPSGDGRLSLVDGPFLQAVEDAGKEPSLDFVVVIEEINRGSPAQIFGEMLTLLEADKRTPREALALSYPRHAAERVHIPPNLYVVGTMNVADRSLAFVDLAFRRRFAFIGLEPVFGDTWRNWVTERYGIEAAFLDDVERRMTSLNQAITDDGLLGQHFRVGHSVVTPSGDQEIGDPVSWFRQAVETEIGPLLEEYWFDQPGRASDERSKLLQGLGS